MARDKKIGKWCPAWARIRMKAREIVISTWVWVEAKVRRK